MTIKAMGQGFSAGISATFRGLGNALQDQEVRLAYLRMVGVLVVIITLLSALGVWGVVALTGVEGDVTWWTLALCWALRIAGIVLVLFVAPIASLAVINQVFPLLAERVFYSALHTVNPERATYLRAQPGLTVSEGLSDAVHRLALFFGLSLVAFVFSLVPVVGSLGGPVAQGYLTSRSLGWEMLDPYFDKLGWRYDDQRKFVDHHRGAMVGFGVPIALLMMIPIVGPLIFGLAQASAALLVADVLEKTPSAPQT